MKSSSNSSSEVFWLLLSGSETVKDGLRLYGYGFRVMDLGAV